MAEGAPLLREYRVNSSIEGSNPSFSAIFSLIHHAGFIIMPGFVNNAPVAQLDRVPGYELGGREFESLRARHIKKAGLYVGFFYMLCLKLR